MHAVYILLIAGALIMSALSCAAPEQPDENEEPVVIETEPLSGEAGEDVVVNIELEDVIDWSEEEDIDVDIPDSLIYSVDVENIKPGSGDMLGVNFVYQALVPTGEETYVLRNPRDPDSGYVENEDGPVLHDVMEVLGGRIESLEDIELTHRTFDVTRPENTSLMKYWVEVYFLKSTGHGEEVFVDEPYITEMEVEEQGGIIPLITR